MTALRIGVVGCGAIARRQHIPALQAAGAQVTAFASRSLASAEAARDEAGGGSVTTDWRDLLDRDDVDAITVCTPNALHSPVAIAAAEAGRHVLVEKPFATSVAQADAMIAAAERAGVVLMAAHNVRFAPPLAAMQRAIASGAIGAPTSARAVFCHAGPQAWAPDAVWFREAESSGGGVLVDLGVHVADTLRFLLGDEVTEVTATVDRLPIDEDAHVTFRTATGVVGSFHVGWRNTPGLDLGVVVQGDDGSLAFDPVTGVRLLRAGTDPEALPLDDSDQARATDPCAAFVRAVVDGTTPDPSAADGRQAVAIVTAAYAAARTGTTTKVEQP